MRIRVDGLEKEQDYQRPSNYYELHPKVSALGLKLGERFGGPVDPDLHPFVR